jgi:eukaryotic-like serine/threonine-protein kinase
MNLTAETALQNGKYVIETQLGQGIFGITYRAINTESSETVVIKTLTETLRQHSQFDQFKQKFLETSELLSCCQHPNLVKVLDWFEDAGRPYLVMEYIPGQTLAELIQSKVFSQAKAIEYIRQIGDGLSVLHAAGLLHLNVKPQNIIRRQDSDSVVLCEFGIACEFTPGIMQTHASLVSAGYAPLELYVFKAKRSPATDIYALAATFYCLVTGRPPLPSPVRKALRSKEGINAAVLQEHRSSLPNQHSSTPKLSPALKQVIGRGLQMAPPRRPQTVQAWLDLLKNPEKLPASQLTLAQPSVVQSGVHSEVSILQNLVQGVRVQEISEGKSESTSNSQPLAPQTKKFPSLPKVGWNLKPAALQQQPPQPALAQPLLPELEAHNRHKSSIPKKFKAPNMASLLQALLMTGAIAASAGVGFGFALRINGSTAPGSTLLHTKQSFPPTRNWPKSEPEVDPQL